MTVLSKNSIEADLSIEFIGNQRVGRTRALGKQWLVQSRQPRKNQNSPRLFVDVDALTAELNRSAVLFLIRS
jgi:hypothetical protein